MFYIIKNKLPYLPPSFSNSRHKQYLPQQSALSTLHKIIVNFIGFLSTLNLCIDSKPNKTVKEARCTSA